MKPYPLEPIRQLRKRHEEEAERQLLAARRTEEEARQAVAAAKKKLEDYIAWLQQEAERLFKTVMGSISPLRKLNQINEQIKWDREQQDQYLQAVEDAKKKLQEAITNTKTCLAAHEKAYKELWKLDQHRKIWEEEEKEKEAKEEEAGLEEVAEVLALQK